MHDDPLVDRLVQGMGLITPTPLRCTAHRHCRPTHGVLDTPPAARFPTRWVGTGAPPTLYLSSSEDGVWSELRKHSPPGVDPTEVFRRIGAVRVRLSVLDLTDPDVRGALDVEAHDLVRDDDLTVCRALAGAAREIGLHGLVSPSAALDSARTIVVFEAGFGGLTIVREEVRSPPPLRSPRW